MAVLVVIDHIEQAPATLRWGLRMARARASTAHVVLVRSGRRAAEVIKVPYVVRDDDSRVEDATLRAVRAAIGDVLAEQPPAQRRPPTLREIHGPDPATAILGLADELAVDLVVAAVRDRRKAGDAELSLARHLLKAAPMAVCLLRAPRDPGRHGRRILVATGGGPQARVALGVAGAMARIAEEPLGVLHVTPPGAPEAPEVGRRHLRRALSAGSVDAAVPHREIVVVADSVRDAIATEAATGAWDLVMVGAHGDGFSTRLLFGTIGEHLLTRDPPLNVAVVRRARPLPNRVWRTVESWTRGRLPQLGREQRIGLVDRLEEGSMLGVDFVLLMTLSTLIAGLGLLQNSTAVVVGAMLVAPLMTPIVGIGLSLVQGNVVLLRTAGRSLGVGFCAALGTGLALGLSVPGPGLTPELIARGGPNLLDLGVAFASGIAGAYAMSRPGLSAALPGVAIAAALVPPIATLGISLARGASWNAHGAALLFGTNVVAIIIGSAITLNALGMAGPRQERPVRKWTRRLSAGLVAATALLAVLLGGVDWSGRPRPVGDEDRHRLAAILGPDQRLVTAELIRDNGRVLHLVVAGPTAPSAADQRAIADAAQAAGIAADRLRIAHRAVHELVLDGGVDGGD